MRDGQRVTVEGVLTIGTGLLDASGRRTILEDGTAAIEVYLAAPDASHAARNAGPGHRDGRAGLGRAAAARRDSRRSSARDSPPCTRVRGTPTAAVEWRLVKVEGTVVDVHGTATDGAPSCSSAGGAKVPVSGLAGSGIPSTAMVEGRRRRSSASSSARIPRRRTGGSRSSRVGRRTSSSARLLSTTARRAVTPPPAARRRRRPQAPRSPARPVGGRRLARRPRPSTTSTCATSPPTSASASGSVAS